MTKKKIGVIVVLGASIMWSIEPILAKLSYQTTGVLNTFATRSIFSLLAIATYRLITKPKSFWVAKEYLPQLVYVSLAATLFADFMYIYALTRVPVLNAVLIGHMQPVFVVFFGYFVLHQDRITKYDYLGILFMILAGLLVTTRTPFNLLRLRFGTLGDLYVLLATVAWATTAIVARKYLRSLDAALIALYRFLFATAVFSAYMMATQGIRIANPYQIIVGVVIGIGTILYYEGIRLIKAAQVSALELTTPFFAAVLGLVVLREYITPMQIAGMLLLGAGIYCLARKEES